MRFPLLVFASHKSGISGNANISRGTWRVETESNKEVEFTLLLHSKEFPEGFTIEFFGGKKPELYISCSTKIVCFVKSDGDVKDRISIFLRRVKDGIFNSPDEERA